MVTPRISARNDGEGEPAAFGARQTGPSLDEGLDRGEERGRAAREPGGIGVYVHFPWCISKCPYCDFVVYAAPREAIEHRRYADAIIRELSMRAADRAGHELETVFFGGGTPSLWEPREVGRVLAAIKSAFAPGGAEVEVSLESDPSSLDGDCARAIADAGVNRLSIGVQSLDDERLRFLGRIHTAADARMAVRAAVRAGGLRISTDVMYAVAGETPEVAAAEARALAELGATHVSAYSLTIEAGTPFGRLARTGKLPLADDGVMAASFFAIDEALEAAGLEHYEISNYAVPGEQARHNVGYWLGRDYVGLGCGAYGTLSETDGFATRYRNHPNPSAYLAAILEDAASPSADVERLDPATRLRERIMLGLRTTAGIDVEAAAAELGTDPYPGARRAAVDRLVSNGRLTWRGSRLEVPREARIWVDDIAARLF
jgi:oxygen-independent coproporphyrinogen-3 oxidase